jgi:hypothetical protein
MTRRQQRIFGIALSLVGAVALTFLFLDWTQIDRCVAAGGSYNYVERACDFTQSQPSQDWLLSALGVLAIAYIGFGISLLAAAGVKRSAH